MNKQDEYFSKHWYSRIDQYEYSGYRLVTQVDEWESVLDVGCGHNMFKEKLAHVVGIDPANDAADVKCTLEDFRTKEKFDVAFCLGSVNFGDQSNVESQIQIISDLLQPKARIYWRCNPGLHDHGNEECKVLDIFPWTVDLHIKLSVKFGFKLRYITEHDNNRIYAEWIRGY